MRKALIPIILVLLLLTVLVAAAQNGYNIPWWSVDGGAQTSSGDGFSLSGIIGQADAGPTMSDGEYTVSGGYWQASLQQETPSDLTLDLPLVQR